MQYESVLGHLHEIALYDEYEPADFQPPYSICMPRGIASASLTPVHISSTMTCISSAHLVLDILLATPMSWLRCSPVIVYARTGYALTILMRIYMSASLPGGALHGVLSPETTRMDLYLDKILRKLSDLAAQRCRIAETWLSIITKINDWFKYSFAKVLQTNGSTGLSGHVEPLRNIVFRENRSVGWHPLPSAEVGRQGNQPHGSSQGGAIGLGQLPRGSTLPPAGLLSPSQCSQMLNPDAALHGSLSPAVVSDDWMSPYAELGESNGEVIGMTSWLESAEF